MTTLDRIRLLLQERGWSVNHLARQSGVLQSTLSNMFSRNNDPSISTLEALCKAFGITMSQFFATGEDSTTLTRQQLELLQAWDILTEEQKQLFLALLKQMRK